MAIKDVLMIGNPELRKKSTRIQDFNNQLEIIIQDLKDTLTFLQKTKKIGRALAAPQIGYKKRVIYYKLTNREIIMVNPEIIEKSKEMFEVWDSCFSFDVAFFVKIKRHKKIKVRYQDEKGNEKIEEFSDDLSELFQHEIDHLYGILATDHLENNKNIIMRSEWEKSNT
ncbi:peptide deformylase [Thermohalobacter berrensis]|uniref:Peptide deformylase n=1 Tax=Thermohalobacter berrensis TaxID=99594 RepID=A0A419SXM4_9FIRM|nr:peptide deformylase [Thermohalobacter berrensis]RKD30010.1 peptide deformylase [Thermohalobacter berrensis]